MDNTPEGIVAAICAARKDLALLRREMGELRRERGHVSAEQVGRLRTLCELSDRRGRVA